MNAKLAKALRKYVRNRFPWIPEETVYGIDFSGGLYIAPHSCRRGTYRLMKKNIKKQKHNKVTYEQIKANQRTHRTKRV
jgi:hypothetical protein